MSATHFSGPLIVGTKTAGETNGPNQAPVILTQFVTFPQNGEGVTDKVIYLPKGSKILGYFLDIATQFDSVTSATVTAGVSTGDAKYFGGGNVKSSSGRLSLTSSNYTASRVAAMAGITTAGAPDPVAEKIVVTLTTVGATTAGLAVFTIQYAQQ